MWCVFFFFLQDYGGEQTWRAKRMELGNEEGSNHGGQVEGMGDWFAVASEEEAVLILGIGGVPSSTFDIQIDSVNTVISQA